MAYLRLYCDVCGGTWDIYHRDRDNDAARQCPHCGSKIAQQTWYGKILPAFAAVHDANTDLYKDHVSSYHHTPLFSFDVIADHLYENRHSVCPVQDYIDEIL